MQNKKIHKISLAAIFTALVFVATYFIAIPMPAVGYVNLGDAFILLAVWILGPVYGAICGGVGAALADLMLGFAVYSPATLIIKALMAIVCYFVFKAITKLTKRPVGFIVGAIAAELVMVLGYFVFEGIFMVGFATASLNIIFNLIQGALSAVVANVVADILFANKTITRYVDAIN